MTLLEKINIINKYISKNLIRVVLDDVFLIQKVPYLINKFKEYRAYGLFLIDHILKKYNNRLKDSLFKDLLSVKEADLLLLANYLCVIKDEKVQKIHELFLEHYNHLELAVILPETLSHYLSLLLVNLEGPRYLKDNKIAYVSSIINYIDKSLFTQLQTEQVTVIADSLDLILFGYDELFMKNLRFLVELKNNTIPLTRIFKQFLLSPLARSGHPTEFAVIIVLEHELGIREKKSLLCHERWNDFEKYKDDEFIKEILTV